jgi:starch synthase (maltosyl-transferring)
VSTSARISGRTHRTFSPQHLQFDGRQEFIKRLILAATLSSNYGIYGPAFELCVREAIEGKEEYLNSEKYEIKVWDRDQPGNIKEIIARLNKIRRANPALQYTNNIQFLAADNDFLLCYDKMTVDGSNTLLIIVNMDPHHTQSGFVKIPHSRYGLSNDKPFHVHDLLTDEKYIWQGEANYVELNPYKSPAHILKIHGPLMKESDFDYFA